MKQMKLLAVVCAMLMVGSLEMEAQIIVGSSRSGVGNTYVKPIDINKLNQQYPARQQPQQQQQSNGQSGTYVPPGGTAPVPQGFKPDIVGTSPNGVPTVNGKERYDLMPGGQNGSTNAGNSSNSSNSSGSSGVSKTCSKCLGSGICKICNGKKWYIPYVGASSVKCSSCNQTGKCSLCNGTGKFGTYRGN